VPVRARHELGLNVYGDAGPESIVR
jgi:hypothetical protein